ncbi:MAG: phage tail protein [Deltaproteobacteria bacterium]|nr:MAG: phage tail protein [Deltaproteobacteria bacterium]
MAQYQRGMQVKARATATSTKVYTRRMSVKASVTAKATIAFTRKMSISAKVTAVSTPKGTRGITEPRDIESPTWPKGTRGIREPFDDRPDLDPWGNYRFSLFMNLDGTLTEVAHFMECSGLKNSAEVFEIQEGGLNGRTHKRPGQSKWENISLRYGTSAGNQLAAWRDRYLLDSYLDGDRIDPEKSSGAIVLYDNRGRELRRYEFQNAWPVSWEGPSLDSGGSALAVETIEIAHEGLTIIEGDGSDSKDVNGNDL